MSKKKNKISPKRIIWEISPITKIVKDKTKYNRKRKHKKINNF